MRECERKNRYLQLRFISATVGILLVPHEYKLEKLLIELCRPLSNNVSPSIIFKIYSQIPIHVCVHSQPDLPVSSDKPAPLSNSPPAVA